jgi:hypothetical protein
MTLEMPTLLALLGTALLAVVIFAPKRTVARAAVATASPAPPLVELPHHTFAHDAWEGAWTDLPRPNTPPESDTFAAEAPSPEPVWPLLVDPRAGGCDAAARWELVDALAAVRAPWSEAILVRALDDESDPDVRNAVRAALAA